MPVLELKRHLIVLPALIQDLELMLVQIALSAICVLMKAISRASCLIGFVLLACTAKTVEMVFQFTRT